MKPRNRVWAAFALAVVTLVAGASVAQTPQMPPIRLPRDFIVGPQWAGWENLGGSLTSAPTCLAPAENRLECYARDTNGNLQRRWWDGSTWNGWQGLPGVTMQLYDDGAGAGPSCVRDNTGMTHCFVWGADNALWHRWFPQGSNGWWESLGGVLTSAPSCAAAPDAPTISCFARGQNGGVWRRTFDGNVWGQWSDTGGSLALGANPSCAARSGGRVDCLIVNASNIIFGWSTNGGGWTQVSGNAVLAYGSLPVSPRCQIAGGGESVACYVPRGATESSPTVSVLRVSREAAGWGVSDLGADFGNNQVELSCVDSGDRLAFECFAILPALQQVFGSTATARLFEFATSPAAPGAGWRQAGIPTPPTANATIHRLSCVSWGPGRIDCFSSSSAGGPMMHVWRTPNQGPVLRYPRRG
ncbi:MAG: hypothetical protein JNM59_01935 [Hyphomonadaceae bacterium]|nr:hypothetical protein [Hyphomonadaceae bacterium]